MLGGITIVLDYGTISLGLRRAQFRPELDNVFAQGLDGGDAARVFFVDAGEFVVKLVDIGGGDVEVGRDGLVWPGGR